MSGPRAARRAGRRLARSRWLARAVACALTAFAASTVAAFIPEADRTLREIAKVNRSSGRSQAVQLELTMRIGDRRGLARGEMISHPSGLARLELRGVSGRVDRYLLSGGELLAAKDGRRLAEPQPMLPPWFFLQPSSEATLRAALSAFDVLSEEIGLATCGDQDCFVIGDPRLSAPPPKPDWLLTGDEVGELADGDVIDDPLDPVDALSGGEYALAAELGDEGDGMLDGGASLELEGPELLVSEEALLPRLWVDTRDLQVRRIDRANGVFTIFGPVVSFEKLRVPAWFEIHEPGQEPIRFDVDRAVKVNAPPQAFSRSWVFAPIEPAPGAPNSPPPSPAPASAPSGPAPTARSSR